MAVLGDREVSRSLIEADMAPLKGQQLTPPHAGLDSQFHQGSEVPRMNRADGSMELLSCLCLKPLITGSGRFREGDAVDRVGRERCTPLLPCDLEAVLKDA